MLQSEILIVEDDRDLAEIAIDYMEEKLSLIHIFRSRVSMGKAYHDVVNGNIQYI